MKFTTAIIAIALATASGVTAQTGCNEQFPDLSTAKGLNATGKAMAEKCEATAKKVPSCAVSFATLNLHTRAKSATVLVP